MPMSAFAHEFEMVVDGQIADSAAKVVKKTVADGTGIDDAPGDDWKKRKQIVTATPFEFITKCRSLVYHFDFPTVGVKIFEGLTRKRSRVGDQRFDDLLPIGFERAAIDWVDGVSAPIVAAGGDA